MSASGSAVRERRCGHRLVVAALLAAPVLTLAVTTGTSSTGASYEVSGQVVGAGAATLSGADGYAAGVVVGQNDASALSGAQGYAAATGFWSVAAQGGASELIFYAGFEPSGP